VNKKKIIFKKICGWTVSIAFAIVIAVVVDTKVFATVEVKQSSMENTLYQGQKLITEKISYDFTSPKSGDIIIFLEDKYKNNYPDELNILIEDVENEVNLSSKVNTRLVKRVIGVPGDEINLKDGFVYINGKKLNEVYVTSKTFKEDMNFPIKVPNGKLFVLGDNRQVSRDSRSFGLIDNKQVDGKVVVRIWPLSKIGKVK